MSEIKMVKTREEIQQEHKWNIEKIYENMEMWEKDFKILKEKAPALSSFNGKR